MRRTINGAIFDPPWTMFLNVSRYIGLLRLLNAKKWSATTETHFIILMRDVESHRGARLQRKFSNFVSKMAYSGKFIFLSEVGPPKRREKLSSPPLSSGLILIYK